MTRDHILPVSLVVLTCLVLQLSLIPLLTFGLSRPNLILVSSVAIGLSWGPTAGAVAGAIGGLLGDICNGRFVGLMALAYGLGGMVAGAAARRVFRENVLMVGLVGLIVSIGADLLIAAVLSSYGRSVFLQDALQMVLFAGFINMLTTPIVFSVVWKSKTKIETRNSPIALE